VREDLVGCHGERRCSSDMSSLVNSVCAIAKVLVDNIFHVCSCVWMCVAGYSKFVVGWGVEGVEWGSVERMQNNRWCSIDPGGTTGLAFWEERELCAWDAVRCGFGWREQMHLVGMVVERVMEWVDVSGRIVLEDFLLRPSGTRSSKRDALSPVQVSGLLLGGLERCGWEGDLVMQSAANAKGVITDERLKHVGLYRGNDHVRDAIRHGVLYMRKVGAHV
jgi:hypothetical protein